MTHIEPTIGRIVWYTPLESTNVLSDQPFAAQIVHVNDDGTINLAVFNHEGHPHARLNVRLYQEDDAVPDAGGYASWMPYQTAQAAKHSTGEAGAGVTLKTPKGKASIDPSLKS